MTDDAAKSLLADLKVGLDMVSSGYISFVKVTRHSLFTQIRRSVW